MEAVFPRSTPKYRTPELCDRRGSGSPVLMVSVDVKQHLKKNSVTTWFPSYTNSRQSRFASAVSTNAWPGVDLQHRRHPNKASRHSLAEASLSDVPE